MRFTIGVGKKTKHLLHS